MATDNENDNQLAREEILIKQISYIHLKPTC